MIQVRIREDESIDKAIARFKKVCSKEGIVSEIKKRSYYEKPSEKRRRMLSKKQRRVGFRSQK